MGLRCSEETVKRLPLSFLSVLCLSIRGGHLEALPRSAEPRHVHLPSLQIQWICIPEIQDIKAKFTQTYKTLEDMKAKVTVILQNYTDAAIAKLTKFSHFINAANAV